MTTFGTTPSLPADKPGIDVWPMGFLMLTPVIGIGGTAVYTYVHGFALWMPLLALGMYVAVGLSICAGYHRFFSHRSYEARRNARQHLRLCRVHWTRACKTARSMIDSGARTSTMGMAGSVGRRLWEAPRQ